jgi:hypothetical protein
MDQMTAGLLVILAGAISFVGALLNWGIVTSPNELLPRLLPVPDPAVHGRARSGSGRPGAGDRLRLDLTGRHT